MKPKELSTLVNEISTEVSYWRRHLHEHPELSFQEFQTAQFVYDTLLSFDGLEVTRPTETGVMAVLKGALPGKTIALRADMDALPIQEDTGLAFASKNKGVMHACNHDGHTAMLLGVAKILSDFKEHLQGEVRFFFQPAEELPPGGAIEMVKAGVMENVELVLGCHLIPTFETGTVHIGSGPMFSAVDNFDITIHGKGGHGASPHDTIDSLAIAAQVVTNIQHIVSRTVDPFEVLALSITKISSGEVEDARAYNVIPAKMHIAGTVRSFNEELLSTMQPTLERIIKGITLAHGASYEFEYHKGYGTVTNDEQVTSIVRQALIEAFGQKVVYEAKPIMPGEDFSEYIKQAPGTYFFIGAGIKDKEINYPLHHPQTMIDEQALSVGVLALLQATYKLLNN